MFRCWYGSKSANVDSGIGWHLVFGLWCIWQVLQLSIICCISAYMVGQYQYCFARLYALSAPVWYWCNCVRSCFLSFFGSMRAQLLCIMTFPTSFSWIDMFSHMGEYSFAGFWAGICFWFLYVLSACIMNLYYVSWLAVCMSFAVGRSSVSYPEALMTLTFACFG